MTVPRGAQPPADQWAGLLTMLESDCTACGATGRVASQAWRSWYERAGELTRVAQVARQTAGVAASWRATLLDAASAGTPAVVMAIERAIDEHNSNRPQEPEETICVVCKGCGSVLTRVGEHLCELLVRHGFVRRPTPGADV